MSKSKRARFVLKDYDAGTLLAKEFGGNYDKDSQILVVPLNGSESHDDDVKSVIRHYGGFQRERYVLHNSEAGTILAERYEGSYDPESQILEVTLTGSYFYDLRITKSISNHGGFPEYERPDMNDPEYTKYIRTGSKTE